MQLSWAYLETLAQQHGDAFYVLDCEKFQANYQDFLQAFRCVYPRTQIAYSYKTNYLPRLCQLVQGFGGYAEVVSGMEYGLALRIGVPPERIIFNGPYKRPDDLLLALRNGSIVNLDALDEVLAVQAMAATLPEKTLRLGIRCNFALSAESSRSRFGFDVDGTDLQAALSILRTVPNCRIIGLHCHYLAPQRSAAAYQAIAQRMLALANGQFADFALEFIDLGGGFFSRMSEELQQQFSFPIPSFAEYGAAIAEVFAQAYPQADGPELILEPGIALSADTMQFVAQVINIKTLGARHLALVAGSIYDIKPTLNQRNLPLTVVSKALAVGAAQRMDLVGYTCMENDCLYRDYQGVLAAGDYVIFDNVGAYTNVLRPPFINPAAPILAIHDAANVEIIRQRETADEVFKTYVF